MGAYSSGGKFSGRSDNFGTARPTAGATGTSCIPPLTATAPSARAAELG